MTRHLYIFKLLSIPIILLTHLQMLQGEGTPTILTLQQCMEKVIALHPSEQASRMRLRAASLRQKASGAYRNPKVSIESENINAEESLQMTYALTQEIELGGQRSARQNAAKAEQYFVETTSTVRRSQLLSEVSKVFTETMAAQHRLTLAKEAFQLSQAVKEIAQRKVEAGKCAPLELDRAMAEMAISQSELHKAESDFKNAKADLAAYLLNDELAPVELTATPWPETLNLEEQEFIHAVLAGPECTNSRADSQRLHAQAKSLKAETRPVLEIGGGLRRMGPDDSYVLSIGMELPLSNRGRQEAASAQLDADAADAEQKDSTRRLLVQAKNLRNRYLAIEQELVAMRNTIIPAIERAYSATEKGYHEGKLGYLDILDSKRSRLEIHRRLNEMENEWLSLRAELGRLCGSAITNNL